MTLLNPDLSEKRAITTIAAAETLREHIAAISDSCNWAQDDEAVLAVIGRDLSFGGALIVPLSSLRETVLSIQETGWTLVFSPGSTDKDIEARCDRMVQGAQARLDAIRRWRAKHQAHSND